MKHHWTRCCIFGCLAVTAAAFLTGCPPRKEVDWSRVYLDARTTLRQAAEDPNPEVRTKALEALAATEGREAGALMMQSLQDQHGPVRFAAAMAVGEVRYEAARPLLLAMAKDPQTPAKLLCAVIYGLHRTGDYSYTTELGRLLNDEDKWIRATAAMVMGRLGEPSAKQVLDDLRRGERDAVVQLQVIEALAALGDQRASAILRAFTKSQFLEDQIIAVQGLGRVRNPGSVYFLRKLMRNGREDPTVRVAAAGSLGQLGEPSGYDLAMRAVLNPQKVLRSARGRRAGLLEAEITNLQSLAVLALGDMGEAKAVEQIHPLVFSTKGTVRVAACKSILQLLKGQRLDLARPMVEEPVRPVPAPPPAPPVPPAPEPPKPPAVPAPVPPVPTQPATEPAATPATRPGAEPPPVGPATQPSAPPATAPAGLTTTQPASLPAAPPSARPGLRTSGARD